MCFINDRSGLHNYHGVSYTSKLVEYFISKCFGHFFNLIENIVLLYPLFSFFFFFPQEKSLCLEFLPFPIRKIKKKIFFPVEWIWNHIFWFAELIWNVLFEVSTYWNQYPSAAALLHISYAYSLLQAGVSWSVFSNQMDDTSSKTHDLFIKWKSSVWPYENISLWKS